MSSSYSRYYVLPNYAWFVYQTAAARSVVCLNKPGWLKQRSVRHSGIRNVVFPEGKQTTGKNLPTDIVSEPMFLPGLRILMEWWSNPSSQMGWRWMDVLVLRFFESISVLNFTLSWRSCVFHAEILTIMKAIEVLASRLASDLESFMIFFNSQTPGNNCVTTGLYNSQVSYAH